MGSPLNSNVPEGRSVECLSLRPGMSEARGGRFWNITCYSFLPIRPSDIPEEGNLKIRNYQHFHQKNSFRLFSSSVNSLFLRRWSFFCFVEVDARKQTGHTHNDERSKLEFVRKQYTAKTKFNDKTQWVDNSFQGVIFFM